MNYVREYIDKLESGEIVTSQKVFKFYTRAIKPIIDGEDKKYYFNEKKGERFVIFAEGFCKQSKGKWAGKPLHLCLFQKAKWQAIFGILDRKTKKRRFTEIMDVRGRKNGKSTEHASVGLYLTLEERGGEIYSAATVRSQALRIWQESQSMIDQSQELQEVFKYKVFPMPEIYTKKEFAPIKSSFYVLSKNVKTLDGLNASGAIIDEIHELPRAIYDILKQSMSTREQPLLSMITTGGFLRGGLFDDEYEYASKVIDGLVEDDTLFPVIYELDSPDEIGDEDCWVKANPALDVIKDRAELRRNVERSKVDLNFANSVRTKDFNILGVDNKAWLRPEDITRGDFGPYSEEEVGMAGSPEQEEFLKRFDGQIVIAGYDLSKTMDMTALTILLFDCEKECVIAKPMYWITPTFLESEQCKTSQVPFNAWVQRGLVRLSGTKQIDYHDITAYLEEEISKHGYLFQYICYDPWSAQYLTNEIENMGFSKDYCQIPVRQGFQSLSMPMQQFESLLSTGKLCYLHNPVFKWNLSNVELEQDRNGNMMPKKVNDNPVNKIDGFATTLNCLYKYIEEPDVYLHQSSPKDSNA